MIPILINTPSVKVYTFGVFLLLAFFWGLFWVWKLIRLTSYKEDELFDGLFISLIVGMIGARLIYVASHFSDFGFNILKIILVNGYPGASLWGFLIGLSLTYMIFLRLSHIPLSDVLDYLIPPLFLSLALGKIGSFLAGVDVGTKTSLILSAYYSGYNGARHITPLYESVFFIISFVISYRILLALRKDYPYRFTNVFLFLGVLGGSGLLLDKMKVNQLYFGPFNSDVIFSLLSVSSAIVYFLITRRNTIKTKSIHYLHTITHHVSTIAQKTASGVSRTSFRKTTTSQEKTQISEKK